MIVGLTSGCFDLVHYGHVLYLERCRKLCDKLIVGVDDDQMVAQWKGAERPIIPELERLEMINNLACVDSAFLLHELGDLARVVRQFRVDKVFKHQVYPVPFRPHCICITISGRRYLQRYLIFVIVIDKVTTNTNDRPDISIF